ncbi:unnamed protein product [Coffea canephora]|uniref:DH200=94 genomic scaffold, scaffold_2930 n=1 Tax=Coffea canephora TaxID=49390 RepID=A0A068VNF9_COFCA|nr:unnamed protein product [Coffea canephora]
MEAFVEILVDTLNSMIQKEHGLLCGVATNMQKLSSLLSTIKAVLEDAEQKQFTNKAIQLWFQKLNGVAYEIDDVLDDYVAEASRVKYKNSGRLSLMCYPVAGNLVFRHRIGTRMKEILEKFNAIANERIKLGLNEEKEQIVHILTKEKDRDDQNVSVLPIVGVGGLGKTTLAQLVFNDERIAEHFEPKLWVWVSEDFDGKRIIKALINYIQRTPTEELELAPLQRNLQELLRGKRYLIVLDDVWNENPEEWEKLKSVLQCGSKGSSIVTTTRMEKVATIMGTLQTYYLSSLSENQCWSLFRQRAFGRQEVEEYPNLVVIGKEIVKKCGGVPLAAKALGGFLRFKREETEWNFVIRLWMANGLISSNGTMEVEDVGYAVLTELHNRSLFQTVEKGVLGHAQDHTFGMHDLVHDLAQSVMEAKHGGTESNRTMMLDMPDDQLTVAFPITRMRGTDQFSSFLSKCGSLRALIVRSTRWGERFTELPHAISNLKHLRHVNLSGSDIVELPNSICDLWNLQILNLNNCGKLLSLPKGMRFLRNLRHLCLRECENLTHMPSGIGKLTCLRTLSKVVLGGKKGFQISELRDLNMLREELSIGHLERVKDKKHAEEACLTEKQSLRKLCLVWDSERMFQQYNDDEVLEALKPCPNLQSLHIAGFKGSSSFPSWISTITEVGVEKSAVEHIVGAQESTAAAAAMSPSLKQLGLRNMPNLKGMLGREVQGTPRVFSGLESLSFGECPTLTLPLPRMPSLTELHVMKCPNMAWASISNLTSLIYLGIVDIEGLSCFPEEMLQNLSLLESLDIFGIHDLRALPKSLASLTALKSLGIAICPKLESLPEEGLRGLASLQELRLVGCYNLLGTLPSSIQMMTTLQSLTISQCDLLGPLCKRGGEEWHKIKHIPDLKIR